MTPIIFDRLAGAAQQCARTAEEIEVELRKDAERIWAIFENLNDDGMQGGPPVSCEEARMRLGLLEQLFCTVLAKAGGVRSPSVEAFEFASRTLQGIAAALPPEGEMSPDALYNMLVSAEQIVHAHFFSRAPDASQGVAVPGAAH